MRQNPPQQPNFQFHSSQSAQHPQRFLRRTYWLLPLLFLVGLAWVEAAGANNWNCQKDSDGKWTCVSQKSEATVSAEPPASAASTPSAPSPLAPPPKGEGDLAAETVPKTGKPPVPVAQVREKTTQTKGAKPGWDCRAGAAKKGWNCALGGIDPKGQAHAVTGAGKPVVESGHYAFTGLDESRFREMMAVIGGDPWVASCAGQAPASVIPSAYADRVNSPLEIESDYSEMEGNELYTFIGDVDMARADQRLRGDFVLHDKLTHTLNSHGNVIYREAGTTVGADTLFMKLDSNEGKLRNAQYIFEDVPARGKAETTYFDGKKHSRYENATFTTCRPGNNDWMIHASRLRVDKNTGHGVASNAWLEFKGVPFFYTPWISFPTDKRRQSGFLAPNIGLSSGMGFSTTLPYYWNIAPNYDATVYPRYNANRGIILGGDLRYLEPSGTGLVQGQYMPDDSQRHQQRGFLSFSDSRTILPQITSSVSLNYVSDNRYLAEMWNTIYRHDFLNKTYLPSSAALNYGDTFGENTVYSTLQATNYQVLADNFPDISKPYRTMPQWSFGGKRPLGFADGVVSMANEMAYFDHSAAPIVKRVNINPSATFPWQEAWGSLTPKLSIQHTQYWVDNSVAVAPNPVSNVGRTTPTFSLDGGLKFDRDTHLFGTAYTQTLEPRLFYLYVPFTNQDNIPVVSSAQYDYTFANLFRENRFTGIDRMGDANQVSAALTSRFIDQTSGREKLRINVGKIFDIEDPKVTLVNPRLIDPNTLVLYSSTNSFNVVNRKDIIAESTAFITDSLKITPLALWNYQDNRADRFQTTAYYDAGNNRLFNIGYRYRRGLTDNTDISMSWPISKEWAVVGRWQYAFQTQSTLESFVGVQRETCCWRAAIIARQYMTNVALATIPNTISAESPMTQGVFLQLELKGFANIGDSIGHFLTHSIPGYEAH